MCVLAGGAAAQQPATPPANAPPAGPPAPKRAQPIEIRGQVPTPQVVTVRPRQVPEFNRQVLVPAFYDRQFWESLLAPYEFGPHLTRTTGVTPGVTTGVTPASPTSPLPADSGQRHSAAATGAQFDSTAVAPSSSPARPARQGAGPLTQGAYSNDPREK
jgi:hypothetical protein